MVGVEKHIAYWRNGSDEDWQVALELVGSGRTRHGLFFAHLALEKMLKEKGIKLDGVVQMEVDDDKLVERISGRFTCSGCGEGYHDTFKKPVHADSCDKCHAAGKFTRRADDNEQTVRERLGVYHTQTAPILPFYESRGMLKRVNGMAGMEAVTSEIDALLKAGNDSDKPPPPRMGG